jgi:hypothetical protein
MTQLRRVVTIDASPDEVVDCWQGPGVQGRVWAHAAELAGVGTLVAHPAPRSLGSEVTLTVEAEGDAALPDPVTGAVLFEALHRLKSLIETGEIPTLDRNPHARHSGPDPH